MVCPVEFRSVWDSLIYGVTVSAIHRVMQQGKQHFKIKAQTILSLLNNQDDRLSIKKINTVFMVDKQVFMV